MPKNIVSDPITDQEMAFALLILSGTMNDRRAAEAVGLNPESAGYIKSKPRVHAYMLEHRAAVERKMVDNVVERLRKLNMDRDQILNRLWELANTHPETTRGSITNQVKAMAMLVAIMGLLPGRLSMPRNQVAPSPAHAEVSGSVPPQANSPNPGDALAAAKSPTAKTEIPASEPRPKPPAMASMVPHAKHDPNRSGILNPFVVPEKAPWIPGNPASIFDAALQATNSPHLYVPEVNVAALNSPKGRILSNFMSRSQS
jgi:hypothetical protein